MNIAVLGTGPVGRALAGRLDGLGHSVVVGTRDPAATLARTGARRHGHRPLLHLACLAPRASVWRRSPTRRAGRTSSSTRRRAMRPSTCSALAGAENLAGKTLLDIANPLDFSEGFPPTLFVKDTDSLAEHGAAHLSRTPRS